MRLSKVQRAHVPGAGFKHLCEESDNSTDL